MNYIISRRQQIWTTSLINTPSANILARGAPQRAIKEEMGRVGRNVLLAYGGGSLKRTGLYDRLRGWLHECGKHAVDFGGIRPSSWRTPTGDARSRWPDYTASVWAAQGYICLAFDAAYQGGSEGEPRNVDKPANRVENIHRACDILAQYPGVDASRVGVLGICGGGGYTLKAAGRALRTCVKTILICSPSFP